MPVYSTLFAQPDSLWFLFVADSDDVSSGALKRSSTTETVTNVITRYRRRPRTLPSNCTTSCRRSPKLGHSSSCNCTYSFRRTYSATTTPVSISPLSSNARPTNFHNNCVIIGSLPPTPTPPHSLLSHGSSDKHRLLVTPNGDNSRELPAI